jgi:hypothetical protein
MNIVGIYPGSFQPPTIGNFKAYEYLKKIVGPNTFVATSDKTELPNAPLNFQDKQQIWTRHGVPIDKVVLTKDPQKAQEITQKYGPDRTVCIFAMSKKDARIALKGGYFLPFQGKASQLEPMNKHSYIVVVPDEILSFHQHITPSVIKQGLASRKISEEQKKSFFKRIFGWYDISLYDLIKKKFAEAATVQERLNEDSFPIIRRTLKPFIREILSQLSQPQGSIPNTTSTSMTTATSDQTSPEDAAAKAKAEKDARAANADQLKSKEMDLKTATKEKEFQKQKVDQVTRYDIPSLTKDIQRLKGASI